MRFVLWLGECDNGVWWNPCVTLPNTGRIWHSVVWERIKWGYLNPLTPNDLYRGRTAPLASKRCILYIYSTNIGTEYFKNGIYSPFLSLQNAICFIILTYLFPVLFTFYTQGVLKFKKNNSGAKRLNVFKETNSAIGDRVTWRSSQH